MLFNQGELVFLGIFKYDYQNFINNLVSETVTESQAYSLFIESQNKRAKADIVGFITEEEYDKIEAGTTGYPLLEADIKEAELLLTAFYMQLARLNTMEDFYSSQSDGRISVTVKEHSKTLLYIQKKAMALIGRWYNE